MFCKFSQHPALINYIDYEENYIERLNYLFLQLIAEFVIEENLLLLLL